MSLNPTRGFTFFISPKIFKSLFFWLNSVKLENSKPVRVFKFLCMLIHKNVDRCPIPPQLNYFTLKIHYNLEIKILLQLYIVLIFPLFFIFTHSLIFPPDQTFLPTSKMSWFVLFCCELHWIVCVFYINMSIQISWFSCH